jgi:hypothetical protein
MLSQTSLGIATEVSPLLRNVVTVLPLHKVTLLKPGPDNFAHNPLPVLQKLIAPNHFVSYAQIFTRKAPAVKGGHAENAKCARARTVVLCFYSVKLYHFLIKNESHSSPTTAICMVMLNRERAAQNLRGKACAE